MTSPDTAAATGYQDRVTIGLLCDALKLLEHHGIVRADDQPWRIARTLEALCRMADAVAGTDTDTQIGAKPPGVVDTRPAHRQDNPDRPKDPEGGPYLVATKWSHRPG